MNLGYFTMPVHPKGRNYAQTLREDRQAFILADKLGYTEGYCGEHLTDECETVPNAMMFMATLLDVTSQMKIGTAVVNLPHSHPVIVASNAAMLDNLFEGRFMFGVGPGILPSDAEALELLGADRGDMFIEAINHIIDIWTGEAPYNLTGKYWNISTEKTLWPEIGLGPIHKPYQKPYPPIVGTAMTPNSQGLVELGKRGWLPMSANFLHENWLGSHWTKYAEGVVADGRTPDPDNWRVCRSIFVADDDKTAAAYGREDARSPYRFYMSQLSAKLRKGGRAGFFKSDESNPDDDVTLDYIMDNCVIAGGVSSVVDQILAMHEKTGDFGTLIYIGKDWADPELGRRSMELMAEKVMPAVNAAIGSSARVAQ
jgi:alkanesulfonate monooxygenase SsuD/methylene tetrahydromethanopterin reductase-like flavin-dependent oxidoreductase (luciferase family)